ncbi:MAG: hypothetical protein V4450_17595 [Bacteroidota bacterium]
MKIILSACFIVCIVFIGHAQLSGMRPIKTSFTISGGTQRSSVITNGISSASNKSTGWHMDVSATTGIINEKNSFFYYGISLANDHGVSYDPTNNKVTTNVFGIGPLIGVQHFYPFIADKLYYSPEANVGMRYTSSSHRSTVASTGNYTTKIITADARIVPFSVAFRLKNNLLATFNLGVVQLSYSSQTDKSESIDQKGENSSFGISINSNALQLGVIFLLKKHT